MPRPGPRPSRKRRSVCTAQVAAGCIRTVGQVTAVSMDRLTASESAPITDRTKGLCPRTSFHGWKWPEIHSARNPACSAVRASSTSPVGPPCAPPG